jgi:hypothetical protein
LVAAATALAAAFPTNALADFTASLSLDQSAGTTAGSSPAIGFDEKFGGDAVKTVSLVLPPGLLANESIAGGGCLRSSSPNPACQVGSGTVGLAGGGSQSFAVDLVKPPNPADVAGLTSALGTTPITTSDVTLGANGAATVVSNLAAGIAETNFTFTDLRLPSSCPSPAANVTMTAVSQSGVSVATTAPLTITGCSGLPYAPTLAVSEAKDAKDQGATLGLDITQAANEAASKTIVLKLPSGLAVNVAADATCLTGAGTGCVIGTATATSPLAPMKLTGTVRLAGSKSSPTVTVSFPAPFAITLVADVSLTAGTVTINNMPDVPLTRLNLTITGRKGQKAFTTNCTPSNTTGTFTSQNGVTKTVSSKVTLTDCAARLTVSGSISGLASDHPKLRIRASRGQSAPDIASVTVRLPAGLKIARSALTTKPCVTKHSNKKCATTTKGLGVSGASVKSVALKGGELVLTLQKAAAGVVINLSAPVLTETSSLQSGVNKHKVTSVTATLKITDAKRTTTSLPLKIKAA